MAAMKPRGGRRGSGGSSRKGGGRKPRGEDRAVAQPAAPVGSSRIQLTHVLREGAIWNVFIATHGAPSNVLLEFERTGGHGDETGPYSTPLTGSLREALYNGGSVSRSDLVHELDRAIQSNAARQDAPHAAGPSEPTA